MNYEKPSMEIVPLDSQDVITLSVNNNADEIIQGEGGNNPWQN